MVSPALGTNPLRQSLFKRTADEPKQPPSADASPLDSPDDSRGPHEPAKELPPSMQAVAFSIGGTRFGVDIRQVSCIVRMVEITAVPRSPAYMEGIVNLRGQIVPVVSLHKLFGWPLPANVLDMYIVVGESGSKPVGLMVDSVTDLSDVDGELLEGLSETDRLSAILSWVAKLDDGIMFVLDFEKIARLKDASDLAAELAPPHGEGEAAQAGVSSDARATLRQRADALRQGAAEEDVELRQFFSFALGNEKYAIDIRSVQKVLVVPEITRVPGTSDHFAGMINHAGDVLWVLDIKTLLTLPASLAGVDERIVVVEYGKSKFGFLADSMCDVVDFPSSAIRSALASTEKAKDDYVAGEAYWQEELIAILDFSSLSTQESAQADA